MKHAEIKSNLDGHTRLTFKAIWMHLVLKEGRVFGRMVE